MPTQAEIDRLDRARIAQADRFIVSLYRGWQSGWIKRETATLIDAVMIAAAMNAEHVANGRRAMIFGIEPDGRETFIAPQLYPAARDY
jgi:hypothetical protein